MLDESEWRQGSSGSFTSLGERRGNAERPARKIHKPKQDVVSRHVAGENLRIVDMRISCSGAKRRSLHQVTQLALIVGRLRRFGVSKRARVSVRAPT